MTAVFCGLEGRGARARQCGNSVAQPVVLAGKGKGGQALADVLFPAGKSTKKGRPASGPGPGPHKNHFQAGNFITRAGFAPHSNNKISNPLGRLFIDGAKGPDKRQQQRHKRNNFLFETARHIRNSVAQPVVLAGKEWGAQALGLDLFFFKSLPGGEKCRIYANRAISGGFNYRHIGGGGVAAIRKSGRQSTLDGSHCCLKIHHRGARNILYGQRRI